MRNRDRRTNKDRKTTFKCFSIAAWDKEQDYLRREQLAGWRLERIDFYNLYRFSRCEPEDVVYQLDYNSEGTAHMDEYVQMFADLGWEHVLDYAGYSYFRKPVAEMRGGDEEIFCDNASRLELLQRVFWGRMMPLLVILAVLVVPLSEQAVTERSTDLVLLGVALALMAVVYAVVLGQFVVRYLRLSGRG